MNSFQSLLNSNNLESDKQKPKSSSQFKTKFQTEVLLFLEMPNNFPYKKVYVIKGRGQPL